MWESYENFTRIVRGESLKFPLENLEGSRKLFRNFENSS